MKKQDIKVIKDLKRLKNIYLDRQAIVQTKINQFQEKIDKALQDIYAQKKFIEELKAALILLKKNFYQTKALVLQEVKQKELEIKKALQNIENEQYNLESLETRHHELCEELQQERDVLKSLVRKEEKFSLSINLLKNNN